jgi:hypothetical protein
MKPSDTPFAEDFDKVLQHLADAHQQIISTPDRCNLIVEDGKSKNIHFTGKHV